MSLTIFRKMFTKLRGLFWLVSLFVIVILDYTKAQDENPIERGPGGECFLSVIICCNKVRYSLWKLWFCVNDTCGRVEWKLYAKVRSFVLCVMRTQLLRVTHFICYSFELSLNFFYWIQRQILCKNGIRTFNLLPKRWPLNWPQSCFHDFSNSLN